MIRRTVSGTIIIAVLIGVVALDRHTGAPWGRLVLLFLVLGLGTRELVVLGGGPGPGLRAVAAVIGVWLLSAAASCATWDGHGPRGSLLAGYCLAGLAPFVGLPLLAWTLRMGPGADKVRAAAWTGFTIAYVGGCGAAAAWLAARPEGGLELLIVLVAATKGTDIGAYFTGSLIGRRKMAPAISPAKTWEGFVGGVLVAGAATAGLSCAFPGVLRFPWPAAFGLGILLGVVGQGGDLFESVIKRSVGVKDSSSLIPGQGGVLDVIDSLLATAPLLSLAVLLQDARFAP